MTTNQRRAIQLTELILKDYSIPSYFFAVANDIFYDRLSNERMKEMFKEVILCKQEKEEIQKKILTAKMVVNCYSCGQELLRRNKKIKHICFYCTRDIKRRRALATKERNRDIKLSPF